MVFLLSPATAQRRVNFILRAQPDQIIANGKSTSHITVEIYDDSVPEGTVINFTTSMEDTVIENSGTLRNKVARVKLRSGTTSGITRVTAFFGSSRETIEIRLVPPGSLSSQRSRVIVIRGEKIKYFPTGKVFKPGQKKPEIIKNAVYVQYKSQFNHQGLKVKADLRLVVLLNKGILYAQGNPGKRAVTLSNGEKTINCESLMMDFSRQVGWYINPSESNKKIFFKSFMLLSAEKDVFENQVPPIALESVLHPNKGYPVNDHFIQAKKIIVMPREKIILRKARINYGGLKVPTIPVYVMPLSSYGSGGLLGTLFGRQMLSMTSGSGFNVDIPVTYRANPSGTGAVHLQHFGGSGFGFYQPGFSMALKEQYEIGNAATGYIEIDQITRPTEWGIHFEHMQRLGNDSQGRLSVALPRHQDLLTNFDYLGRLGTVNVNTQLNYYQQKGLGSNMTVNTSFQLPTKKIGATGIEYGIVGGFQYRKTQLETVSPFAQSVDITLYPMPIRLPLGTSLNLRLNDSLLHDELGFAHAMRFSATLRRQFKWGAVDLGYSFDEGLPMFGNSNANQSLRLSFNAQPTKSIYIHSSAYQSLNRTSLYGSSTMTYRPSQLWNLRIGVTHQGLSSSSFTDYEFSIGRRVKNLDLSLNWSRSRGKIFLEMGSFHF